MGEQNLWNFGPFRLDARNEQLWRKHEVLHLTGKALAVLRYLVEHQGQLVTKDDLFAAVWPEVIVSDAALVVCIRELRQALGDERRTPQFIETVHGRGYRFIGKVVSSQETVASREEEDQKPAPSPSTILRTSVVEGINRDNIDQAESARLEGAGPLLFSSSSPQPTASSLSQDSILSPQDFDSPTPNPQPPAPKLRRSLVLAVVLLLIGAGLAIHYLPRPTRSPQDLALRTQEAQLPLPDKPSIIVPPFVNLSGDPAQEYFSDGITEEITATLSRVSGLFVTARTSAFFYKNKQVTVQNIGREMGVRYVLEGSVQKAEGRVRVTVQLIDAVTGGHVWASHYDRELRDIFTLQDEIVQKIVTALKVNLLPDEQEEFRRAPTADLEAYDDFLRGRESYLQDTKEANAQARQLFEHALALDSQYAGAYAGLSYTYLRAWLLQWSQDRRTLEQAFDAAQKALALDDTLPLAYMVLSQVYSKKNQHEQALVAAERAIALNPNNANAYMALADQMGMAGRPEEGIVMAKTAMRLNPHYPPWYLLQLGSNYHQAWRNEEAIETLKRFLVYYPNALNPYIMLTCSYSDAGRMEEARAEAAEVMQLSPHFSTEVWRQNQFWKDPKEMERHLNNLRKAGLK